MEIETEDPGGCDIYACHTGRGARWEASIHVACEDCGSNRTDASVQGDMLVLTCHDCPNWYMKHVDRHIWVDHDDAIRVTDQRSPFVFHRRPNRW